MDRVGLPEWLVKLAYKFVDVEKNSPTVDERVLEYSFAISKIAQMKPGNLLDVGCVARMNLIPAVACELGWKVQGIDIRNYNFEHPNFTFMKGSILGPLLRKDTFDVITCISTLEHIGIKGRYGEKCIPWGDRSTFNRVRELLQDKGAFLVTLPFGKEYQVTSLNRIYDRDNLDWLCKGWKVVDEKYVGNLAMLELQK